MGSSSANTVLYTLAFLGFYGTWGRSIIDGTLKRLLNALHATEPFIMPGTSAEPLKKNITGVYWPLDYLLNMLILFFWEAVDGSHPTTSTVALYFAGQHLSIVTLLYVDSFRSGNCDKKIIGATLWLLIFQLSAIGSSGPWFARIYLSASPLSQTKIPLDEYLSLHLARPINFLLLPISATISYIVPVILMALRSPSVVSHDFKQLAIALWNAFPLITTASQWLLAQALSFSKPFGTLQSKYPPTKAQHLHAIRITYAFSLTISCACHVGICGISLASVLFPMMFAPDYRSALLPGKLLLPPTSWARVSTFGEGDLGFMKWDETIGYSCMIFLAGITYRQAQDQVGQPRCWWLYYAIFAGCVIGGPGSTALAISWAKDEMLFATPKAENYRDRKLKGL